MRAKKFRDGVGRFAGDDEIEIAHDFLATAKTSRHAHLQRIIVRGQIASQLLGLSRNLPELKRPGMLSAVTKALANFGLCYPAKPRQLVHPPRSEAPCKIRV